MKRNKKEIEDACPFPPGIDLPRKSRLGGVLGSFLVVDWRVLAPMLSLGVILIVSGLLIAPPIPFTSVKEPKTWNNTIPEYKTAYFPQLSGWVPKYPKQVIHDGDLILQGREEYLIENCTYILNGELQASENSSLVLRNSELWVQGHSSHPPWVDLNFTDSSSLSVYNSKIVCPIMGYGCTVILLGDSVADVRYSNVTFVDFNGDARSKIQIDHSTVGAVYVASNASCSIKNSDVSIVGPGGLIWGVDPSFPLMSTYGSVLPWVNTRVEVRNSSLGELLLRAIGSRIVVNGSITKEVTWNPSSFCSGGRWFNMSVVDTNIGRVLLWADNSTLNVSDNRDLEALTLTGGSLMLSNVSLPGLTLYDGNVDVSDSVLRGLVVYRDSHVSIKDSQIQYLNISDFDGGLSFDGVSVFSLTGYNVNSTLRGSLRILSPHAVDWPVLQQRSKLKREYGVVVEAGGVVAQGVGLSLRNGNRTLWSGTTDSSGQSFFNATFYHIWSLGVGVWADDNSTSILTLAAKLGNEVQTSDVTIESSSPIVFSFESALEVPPWGNRLVLLPSGTLIILLGVGYTLIRTRRKESK